jgi:hypothetical protein
MNKELQLLYCRRIKEAKGKKEAEALRERQFETTFK